ncbi:MAG: hypothetical protein AUJ12_08350 [Alphaproteobacteria bacterium CG1_02_46_17]|nr:MAG: hypothetical protein AUJ12_08350 [Alphaproteobacteria bacterium CG1_02_46_17]
MAYRPKIFGKIAACKNTLTACRAVVMTSVLLVAVGVNLPSSALASVTPDNQKAIIEIHGTGVSPLSKVALSAGKGQAIQAQADKNGNFVFTGLQYFSFVPLNLRISLPDQSSEAVVVPRSVLDIALDPYGSMVSVSGKISPAGSIAINIDGVEANSQIAGQSGEFSINARTPLGLADGTSSIMASIINVGEACCPSTLVPVAPVQLLISSIGVRHSSPTNPVLKKPPVQNAPSYMPPAQKQNQKESPALEKDPAKEKPKKSPAPYMVLGTVQDRFELDISDQTQAISFPSSSYDSTWVGGMKKLTDMVRNAIVTRTLMIGAFIDGRATNAALGSVRKLNAQAMKDYQVSDTICKFGTLTRSIAGSDTKVDVNKLAFNKILLDRDSQVLHTMYGESTRGMVENLNDFKAKYCEGVDANNGLSGYCNSTQSVPDKFFNRDVDYTRVFDLPLTLDVDYSDATLTEQEQQLISLFQNLSLRDPVYGLDNGKTAQKQDKTDDFQDLHQVLAARQLVGNTFANQVAMKAKGNGSSATYMKNVLTKLGLGAADATKLIGDNPSYEAQMEILTKKLYQDPAFYANLYDTPANVDRQKVAITAVDLMQERDFLGSLKRKEMLLSELLEMKLRRRSEELNQGASAEGR